MKSLLVVVLLLSLSPVSRAAGDTNFVVVFVDDTLATSSKSAVWIARAFLQRPEVQAFARGELGE